MWLYILMGNQAPTSFARWWGQFYSVNQDKKKKRHGNVIGSSWILKFKNNRRRYYLDTKSLYSDCYNFMAGQRKYKKRGRSCKGLSTYLFWRHRTTPSLTDSYQYLTSTSKLNCLNFQIIPFLYILYFDYLLHHTF